MRAVLVGVDGPPARVDIDGELPGLQAAVGGSIEVLGYAPGITAWINEDGKGRALPVNRAATRLCRDRALLQVGDWIAGPMLLTGATPAGDVAPLPDWYWGWL